MLISIGAARTDGKEAMLIISRVILLSLLGAVLVSCATAPTFDTAGVDKTVTPASAVAEIGAVRGQKVQWGGAILASDNLAQTTQLEVLGYPLEDNGRPITTVAAQRRFLVLYDGYLETADYTAGRLLTVVGQVTEVRKGKVGQADYQYPVVSAQQLYLWPQESDYYYREPAVHFGIGVGIGL